MRGASESEYSGARRWSTASGRAQRSVKGGSEGAAGAGEKERQRQTACVTMGGRGVERNNEKKKRHRDVGMVGILKGE
jgi:hypothetical protein